MISLYIYDFMSIIGLIMKKFIKHIWLIMSSVMLFFFAFPVWAEQASSQRELGAMAGQVIEGPMAILYQFMDDACYITGIVLIVIAFGKYMRHRDNPQEVPLSVPIIYLILAICIILLPLTYYLVQIAGK